MDLPIYATSIVQYAINIYSYKICFTFLLETTKLSILTHYHLWETNSSDWRSFKTVRWHTQARLAAYIHTIYTPLCIPGLPNVIASSMLSEKIRRSSPLSPLYSAPTAARRERERESETEPAQPRKERREGAKKKWKIKTTRKKKERVLAGKRGEWVGTLPSRV